MERYKEDAYDTWDLRGVWHEGKILWEHRVHFMQDGKSLVKQTNTGHIYVDKAISKCRANSGK